jgi:hypothetical protein
MILLDPRIAPPKPSTMFSSPDSESNSLSPGDFALLPLCEPAGARGSSDPSKRAVATPLHVTSTRTPVDLLLNVAGVVPISSEGHGRDAGWTLLASPALQMLLWQANTANVSVLPRPAAPAGVSGFLAVRFSVGWSEPHPVAEVVRSERRREHLV